MPSRYTRDELIISALDLAVAPQLMVHDVRDGVVLPDAHSLKWLQYIIDYCYHMSPFSATITKTACNATANSDEILLPTDFILDVRNGYVTQCVPGDDNSYRRRLRVSLQSFIDYQITYQGRNPVEYPILYNILGPSVGTTQYRLKITPTPTINTLGHLWYYQLPPPLEASDVPVFPNDYIIVEYIKLRAEEWIHRITDVGIAQAFCDKMVAGMKAAGLLNEPESTELPLNDLTYRNVTYNRYNWMGPR
jgi:hypothetical protein